MTRAAERHDRAADRPPAPEPSSPPTGEERAIGSGVGLALLVAPDRARRGAAAAGRCSSMIAAIVVMIFLHELGHYLTAKCGGHEGHRVLHRLRAPHLVVPAGRDRVRPQGPPGRRLREDHRDAQPRRVRPGRRRPHLHVEAVLAAPVGGRRRLDDALPPRHLVCFFVAFAVVGLPRRSTSPTELEPTTRAVVGAPPSAPTARRPPPASRPATAIVSIDGVPIDDVRRLPRGRRRPAGRDRRRRRRARRRGADPREPPSASAIPTATARAASSASAASSRPTVTVGPDRRALRESLGRLRTLDRRDVQRPRRRSSRPAGWPTSASRVLDAREPTTRRLRRRRRRRAAAPSSDGDERSRPVSIVGVTRSAPTCSSDGECGDFLWLFAILNIFIGIFNLVPLLPLDGGHVAIATYEKIRSMLQGGRRYHVDVTKLLPAHLRRRARAGLPRAVDACTSTSPTRSAARPMR